MQITSETATLTIREPRLCERAITVTAASHARLALHTPADPYANTWYTLVVDDRSYDLIMWKHTIGRPETLEALERALETVRAAIRALAG